MLEKQNTGMGVKRPGCWSGFPGTQLRELGNHPASPALLSCVKLDKIRKSDSSY